MFALNWGFIYASGFIQHFSLNLIFSFLSKDSTFLNPSLISTSGGVNPSMCPMDQQGEEAFYSLFLPRKGSGNVMKEVSDIKASTAISVIEAYLSR